MAKSIAAARHHRWAVASRAVAAIPVNYVLTSIITGLLARTLPMQAAEASVAATLLSFLIFALIALAIFSGRSLRRIWTVMAGALLILGSALALSIWTGGLL